MCLCVIREGRRDCDSDREGPRRAAARRGGGGRGDETDVMVEIGRGQRGARAQHIRSASSIAA